MNLTEDGRLNLEAIVADGLGRGLSPYQIISQNGGEEGLGICEKTFYTYINSGVFNGINRLDMRAKMYKPRRKNIERMYKKDKLCLNGRRYEDYLEHMASFPAGSAPSVVEMDSVAGRAGTDDYCLLTIHFTSCNFQLAYVREKNTCESVEKVFKWLYETLEHEDFTALFPVILTDKRCPLHCSGEIPLQPEIPPPACKSHDTGIVSGIFPRFTAGKCVLRRRAPPPPFQPEKHGSDKIMKSRFPEFIFPGYDLHTVFQIKVPFCKFPEIFNI